MAIFLAASLCFVTSHMVNVALSVVVLSQARLANASSGAQKRQTKRYQLHLTGTVALRNAI